MRGFRLAASGFSREVRSAAWEPRFPDEVAALFWERVEPQVEIIEEKIGKNASLRELVWSTVCHGATPAGGRPSWG